MDFQIVWTESASEDLEAIVAHIAEANPVAAERVGDTILKHVEVLQTFPRIGPRYAKDPEAPDPRDPLRQVPHILPRRRGIALGRNSHRMARRAPGA
jgi:plasmid stabilization system protein ParE